MSKPRSELAQLKARLALEQSRLAGLDFTVENLTNGHVKQAEALRELLAPGRKRVAWLTPRRAAKTTAASFALALYANDRTAQDRNLNFIGLSKDHAREIILEESFLPLCEKYKLRVKPRGQEITFLDTNATVHFFGSDDERHIKTNLGKRIDMAVIDECQDQPYLKKLVEKILGPALQDSGQSKLLLAGTRPDSKRHYFWKIYQARKYLTRTWTPRDNPHLADFEGELRQFMAETQLTMDDPTIQADWLGNFEVWDESKTPFNYRESINRHELSPARWLSNRDVVSPGKMLACHPATDIEWYSIGIDPGGGDRWAIVLWGWSRTHCYQIAEWVCPKDSNVTTWDPAKSVLDLWFDRYSPITRTYRDAGSTKDTVELFGKFMRRYVLAAATKTARRAQVERFSTYLQRGTILCIPGLELENDLQQARWSAKALEEGRYEWDDTVIHPDVADAARYGLQGYFELRKEQDKGPRKTEMEVAVQEADQAFRKQFTDVQDKVPDRKERDSESIWKRPKVW